MNNRRRRTANRLDVGKIERRMRAILDSVDYDFGAFTMDGFREYLETCTGRQIEFVDLALQSGVSGAWVPVADGRDYVITDANVVSAWYKGFIKLHELSHILCCHPPADSAELLEGVGGDVQVLLLRSGHSEAIDLEAEMMATLIQGRVASYGRQRELLTTLSSEESVAEFIRVARLA